MRHAWRTPRLHTAHPGCIYSTQAEHSIATDQPHPQQPLPGHPTPQGIIERIRLNNSPQISSDKVLGFKDRADAEAYMSANSETVLGAVHFVEGAGGRLEYLLQSSSTVRGGLGGVVGGGGGWWWGVLLQWRADEQGIRQQR
jgi:hypothetical protein